MRSEEEIQEMLNESFPDGTEGASRWPGMTYEQGVEAMALWALGVTDEHPMAD